MAIVTCIVHCLDISKQKYRKTCAFETRAQIDVFIIQEIAFVETIYGLITFPGKEHEHPANPIRFYISGGDGIVKARDANKGLFDNSERRWKTTGIIFKFPLRVYNLGSDHTIAMIFKVSRQPVEGIPQKPNVRVQNTKIVPPGLAESKIMIGAKSLRAGIANDGHRVAVVARIESK